VQFKDYTSSPIGFGIAVFCMVAPGNPEYQRETYARFYDEFASAGEFNVPCDRAFASQRHSRNSWNVYIGKQLNRNAIVLLRVTNAIDGANFRSSSCKKR